LQSVIDNLKANRDIIQEKRTAFRDKLAAQLEGHVAATQLDEADLQQLISNLLLEENLALINEISAELTQHTGSPQALMAAVIAQKDNIMALFQVILGELMPPSAVAGETMPAAGETTPAADTIPATDAAVPADETIAAGEPALGGETKDDSIAGQKLDFLNRLLQESDAIAAQDAPTQGDVQDAFILSTVLTLLNLPLLGPVMGFVTFLFSFVYLVFNVDDAFPFTVPDIIDVINGGTEDD
jgi:hypothetical protein